MIRSLILVTLLFIPIAAGAQADRGSPSEPSLGDVARQKKSQRSSQPSKVVDETVITLKPRIIPEIFSGGLDNSDEIIAAIDKYRADHTPAETEQVIRAWWEEYDTAMESAIEENKSIETAPDIEVRNRQDYERAQLTYRRNRERHKENSLMMARIQQTFGRVRNHLNKKGLNYDWFKIRCGNGNCSW